MNILVVCQYYEPEPFKVSRLCAELAKKGHKVTVLTGIPNYPEGRIYPGFSWNKQRHTIINNVEIIRVPLIPRGSRKLSLMLNYLSFAIFGSLFSLGIFRKYDYVFVYQLSPVFMVLPGIAYAKFRNISLIIYILDLWPNSFLETEHIVNNYIKVIIYSISKWIYKQCSRMAVSSRGFIKPIEEMGIEKRKIEYIPQFSEDPYGNLINIKHDIFNNSNAFSIIFAGNIGYAQGLEVVIEAASIIKTKQTASNIRWLIVGNGRAKKDLINLCFKKGVDDTVKFIDRVSSLEAYNLIMRSDAALLVLSKSKLFSLTVPAKLQTYMACGVPILCVAGGESAEVVREAQAGVVSEPGNAEQLAEKAIALSLLSKKLLNEYANNARRFYLSNFTIEKHLQNILSLFEEKNSIKE